MPKKKKPKKFSKSRKKEPLKREEIIHKTRIRVIGIGGGGGSIVSEIAPKLKRVDFVAANTDLQALRGIKKVVRIFPFGQNQTRGLGCGMDPKVGQKAVREDENKITKLFKGIDLSILVATLGGGTSSGATPEFAKIAKEIGVKTFGIFTLPFKFEGLKKIQIAKSSLEKIAPHLNAFCVIPNENIFKIIDKSTPITAAFSSINKRLETCLQGLIEMIYLPGLINIDFADLKTVLDGRGKLSYLNTVISQGPNRSEEAAKEVLRSPLNEYSILGAEKIIYNITASQNLGMKEVEYISQAIADFNRKAKIIFGVSQDTGYKDKIRITLLAVGCGKEPKLKVKPKPKHIKRYVLGKPKPEAEPNPEAEPKERPKPKPKRKKPKKTPKKKPTVRTQPKLRAKPKHIKRYVLGKPKPKPEPELEKIEPEQKPLTRKNALDLRREAEEIEKALLEQESQWDTPAFLRKKPEHNQ